MGVLRLLGWIEPQPDHSREIEELRRMLLLHAKKKEVEIITAKKTIREDLKTLIGERLRLDSSTVTLDGY